jgi:hypothetical protein
MTMPQKKTRRQREAELQSLIVTPQGRQELEALAARYQAAGGKARPPYTSVVTYIIVHARSQGLIDG